MSFAVSVMYVLLLCCALTLVPYATAALMRASRDVKAIRARDLAAEHRRTEQLREIGDQVLVHQAMLKAAIAKRTPPKYPASSSTKLSPPVDNFERLARVNGDAPGSKRGDWCDPGCTCWACQSWDRKERAAARVSDDYVPGELTDLGDVPRPVTPEGDPEPWTIERLARRRAYREELHDEWNRDYWA